MTLILTALTPQHIVQVSDRRFVWTDSSGQIVKHEDGNIKAVITPGFACSYTGLAKLGTGDTAEWIAIELSDHILDPDGGISALLTAAQQEVKRQTTPQRPLAIVCAGWGRSQPGSIESRIMVITNFAEDIRGTPHDFVIQMISLRKERQSLVYSKGQPLHSSELNLNPA